VREEHDMQRCSVQAMIAECRFARYAHAKEVVTARRCGAGGKRRRERGRVRISSDPHITRYRRVAAGAQPGKPSVSILSADMRPRSQTS